MSLRQIVLRIGVAPGLVCLLVLIAGCGDGPLAPGGASGQDGRGGHAGAPGTVKEFEEPADPENPEAPEDPELFVVGQAVIQLVPGVAIEDVHAIYGTTTVAAEPGRREYLVAGPEGVSTPALISGMSYSGLCVGSEPNYRLGTPESEQASLAIYEGIFGHSDYVDQEALSRIRAPAAQAIANGAGVLVAVLDTGADLDHPDLADNLVPGLDLVDNDLDPSDLPNGIDDDHDGFLDEAAGHGSHVAGIVAAVAPAVAIMPIRVLDSEGNGDAFAVARGIYAAIDAGANVINLSLGLGETVDVMKRAIQEARQTGILVIVSAGNAGTRIDHHFPANLSEAMTIAATDRNDLKAYFSNFGSSVSVSAPGAGIMSTYWNGGYALWSGTSMAAPFTAGAAALRLSQGSLPPGDLQQRIEEASYPLDARPHPYMGELGEGRLDLLPLVLEPAFLISEADQRSR
jgi:subtilisin family serine protease